VLVEPLYVLTVIMLGATVVVWLWWHGAPSMRGVGDWVTNAGRITGLLAGYAVAVLLALMARIPALDRGIGTDRLARWHSTGGRYTVGLVLAHGVLITWGYALTAHTTVFAQATTLIVSYPDVLAAVVAGLLLVAVGLVSARRVYRRLRYETWYYLHLYTYLAVALAFSHQFASGADFINNRAARVVWSAMYLTVACAVVWYRILTPVRQALRHRLRVIGVRREAPGVVSVLIGGVHVDELQTEPGQFFRWRFLTKGLWWAANPYSLSAPVEGGHLRITVKSLGDHSAAVARLRPGTRVFAEGPYGGFIPGRRRRRKVLLIGGGIGITPIRALFEALPAGPGDLTLVYRVGRAEEAALQGELETIAASRGARLHVVSGHRDELGADPLSATALRRNIPDLRDHDVFLCGPAAMRASVTAALRSAGVSARHIHQEAFEF
jgi:predicted ferric reductase